MAGMGQGESENESEQSMTEIEYLDEISSKLQTAFNLAADARDEAQSAMTAILNLKQDLMQRKIEIQRVQLLKEKSS